MATDVSSMPGVNGYAPHQGYGSLEHPSANPYAQSSTPASATPIYDQPAARRSQDMPATAPPTAAAAPAAAAQQPHSDVPKDEVGWYFVEQYYTTLSRSPEKLYLFYNKRSQYVSGQETDKVPVCVGQRAINDRIKELDFQDCKVRVTNVDSQASDSNIVIQVIGEMSNKGQPHKKFAQTFVLAAQTNGYFVLNDIFRYLIEEEDEGVPEQGQQTPAQQEVVQQAPAAESGVQEPLGTAQESTHETLTSSTHPVAVERDAEAVDRALEEKLRKADQSEVAQVNGDSSAAAEEVDHVDETPAAPAVTDEPEEKENAEPAVAEAVLEPEKPKDPSPSPAATPAPETPQQPAPAPKPAVPKTWASLAASANRVATPQASQQAPAQPRPAPASKPQSSASSTAQTSAAASAPPAATTPAASASQREEPAASAAQDEWTAVPSSHNRQQSRQATTFQSDQSSLGRGYIKNVSEAVSHEELRSKMEQFGELLYFDISRAKVRTLPRPSKLAGKLSHTPLMMLTTASQNSAFVDFKSPDSYRAAVAANPHTVASERLLVEPRRVNPNGPQGIGRGGPYQRGGAPRGGYRGRGDFAGGRGGRGGAGAANNAPRGRGGAQQGGA